MVAVLSMFRSNLYRLVRTVATWGSLAAFVATIVLLAAIFYAMSDNALGDLMLEYLGEGPITCYAVFGETFVSGSLLGIFAVGACSVFFVRDFEKGFIKNLMQIRGGRASYAVAALLTTLVICAVYLVVAMLVTELAFNLFLFKGAVGLPPLPDLLVWFAQTLLVTLAYAVITLFVALLTRSNVCGTVAAILLPSGALENVLQMVLANLFPSFPPLRDCLDGSLNVLYGMLSSGPVPGTQLYLTTGTVIVVAFVACVVAMVRKDVK